MNSLQHKILEIYKEVKKILEKNNIRYFAVGGTAIGAVRHNGFIPWDDDLDVLIPDNEIDKFLTCCKKELPSNLKIFDSRLTKNSMIFFYKIYDTNTTYLEKATYKYKDYKYGVFIDIKPIYGLPDISKIKNYNFVCTILRVLDESKKCSLEQLPLKQKVITVLIKPINILLPFNYWRNLLFKYQSRYDFDSSNYVGLAYISLNEKLIYKKEWFDDYVDIKFEDTTIRCCKDYDKYLTTQHGNYMTLPPESERVSHHNIVKLDLNNSYTKYDDELQLIK